MTKADTLFFALIAAVFGIILFRSALSNAWKKGRGLSPDQDSKDNPYKDDEKFANIVGAVFYIILFGVGIASCTGIIDLSKTLD